MRAVLASSVGLLLGCAAAWHLFAILFVTPTAKLFPSALVPAGLLAIGSFSAVRFNGVARHIVWSLFALAPSLVFALGAFIGTFDARWLVVGGSAMSIGFAAGWLGAEKKRPRESDEI